MRVWDPLEGWLRMTGVLRSEWAGEPLARWLHPCDGPALIDLHRQMEHGAGCAELRLGRYGQWAPCLVQTSAWVLGGAAVSVSRLPPAGGTAITCATRYVYVDSAAEELLGLSARLVEGTSWRDRLHPVDVAKYTAISALTHQGKGGVIAAPVRTLVAGGGWKLFEAWTQPEDGGLARGRFRPMPTREALGSAGAGRLPRVARA